MINNDLKTTTGLTSEELSEVLQNNPRAYMAVRGAVAEKHLEKYLRKMKNDGSIEGFRVASGDMEKDFYISKEGREFIVECKNVEVIKTGNKPQLIEYLHFLIEKEYMHERDLSEISNSFGIPSSELNRATITELKKILKCLPQNLRESGISKYEFSASLIEEKNCESIGPARFIDQFTPPLTIDFQRTRNSTDKEGSTRRQRLYQVGEINIVAACLFSRTLEWQFLFGKSDALQLHKEFSDRYSNRLTIEPGKWTNSLNQLLSTT